MKVLGLGNALVDIMTRMDKDDYLKEFDLPKGSMILVDADKSNRVYEGTGHLERTLASGGSAANTIHGLSNLDIETGFIGKIGRDEIGEVFYKDLLKSGIKPHLLYSRTDSGKVMVLVSPDSERTFATYLGAAVEMKSSELRDDIFEEYDIFHIEGYIVQDHELLETAMKKAKKHGLKISIDMASYNVVDENLEFLKYILQEYVDIVFANEEEARSLTGKEPHGALFELAGSCEIAVVKTGKKGSLILHRDQKHEVGVIDVVSIDTTGAGDLYAAGFLYGLLNDLSMENCGRIGSLLAGKVIGVMGPKISEATWKEVRALVKEIIATQP